MAASEPDLRARIEALPSMGRALLALEGRPAAYLVGGAVRDLLRGEETVDLDIAVEGAVDPLARKLADRVGGEVERSHERFGTATIRSGEVRLDLARSRSERYPRPGALPEVEPAPIEDDLGRRDFTINAMAAPLASDRRGELLDPHGGCADLVGRLIRVLHPASFRDDPTRLLRAFRYAARLDLDLAPETDALAREAVRDRVLDTVSNARMGAELMLLLAEPAIGPALEALVALGLDRVLEPALAIDSALAARAAEAARAMGADRAQAALSAIVAAAPEALEDWLDHLGLPGEARGRVARAARAGPALAAALRAGAEQPSDSVLRDLLGGEPPEALALALALGAAPETLARYRDSVRPVRLAIGGDDLVAAGIEPSPALGRALEETLRRKLDGQVAGREEELRLALALARGENGRR